MRHAISRLETSAGALLAAAGADPDEAEVLARILVWNDAIGRSTHGLRRLPTLVRGLRAGMLSSPAESRFHRLGPSSGRLDGGNGFGPWVASLGMQRAIDLAAEEGIGVVFVHRSNWFGTGAWFVEQAARIGMVGVAASNSFPKVAAHGGRGAVFGTNPLAFGVPRPDGRSILVDMATSSLAGSRLREHLDRGSALDPGVALDESGQPTTDPAEAERGVLLPLGGAKGYGLALMVEILAGVLSGAGFSHGVSSMYAEDGATGDSGHVFAAVDVSRIMPPAEFHRRMDRLVETLRASGPESGAPVRLPGEVRWDRLRASRERGVALDESTLNTLIELGAELGVSFP